LSVGIGRLKRADQLQLSRGTPAHESLHEFSHRLGAGALTGGIP
jgi:hypothetical protein